MGFSKEYWDQNYNHPEEMDGIVNAKEHANYIKATFAVEYIDISSIVDLGFGLGHLFEQVLKDFMPYKAFGIEPSQHAYESVEKRDISPCESTKLALAQMDLVKWANSGGKYNKHFDLGLCTSVFQYLTEEEIDIVLPVMANRIKFLYFSVPTDVELDRQIEELEFKDEYAIRRSREWYLKKLSPYFTVVSLRLLESKSFFSEEDSFFTDLMYRF